MKSYNEMANKVFERRDQYEANKKQKRKILTRTLTPVFCLCIVLLLGVGLWQGDWFNKEPIQTVDDSVVVGEKDWYGPGESEPSNNTQDDNRKVARTLTYNGKRYLEVTNLNSLNYSNYDEIVLGEKIGNGEEFEGTYTDEYMKKLYGTYTVDGDTIRVTITSEVFTVDGNEDLLCVKLSNGDINILKTYD